MRKAFFFLFFSATLLLLAFPAAAKETFSFAVFGDNRDGDPVFGKLIQTVNLDPSIDFAVSLGDIVPSGRADQYQRYLTMIQKAKFKIYHCIGNHELPNGGYYRFVKYFGRPYYSWDFKNSHFIKLDNVSQIGLGKDQENWLAQNLATQPKQHLFVFLHKPMFDATKYMPHYVMSPRSLVEKLHALFQKKQGRIVFAGHTHGYGKEMRDGITYIISGGAGSPLYLPRMSGGFYHYVKVTVRGPIVTTEVVKIEPPY